MLPEVTDILIVGAGPAGLACAVSLLNHGVKNILIVDAQKSGQNISRAIVIHAQTIEDLDSIGCSDQLVSRGLHAQYMTVHAQRKPLVKANFGSLSAYTRFPYALLISQSETEGILEERLKSLGVCVNRPFKVSNFEGTEVGIKVSFESGEGVCARYVIGADGAHSIVRKLAGISFIDPSTKQDLHTEVAKGTENTKQGYSNSRKQLIIADVHLTGHIPPCISPNDLSTFLGPLGFLLLVPLPPAKDDPEAKPIYRMSCPAEKGAKEVTISRLQSVLVAALGLPKDQTPTVDTLLWSSSFSVRSAVAKRFFQRFGGGSVILVGDAAHVHSPAGGQGMNLGIRDAIQLGRTLGSIISSESTSGAPPDITRVSTDKLLECFSKERRTLAKKVIKMTKVMTWATGLQSIPARKTRNIFWGLSGRSDFINNTLAMRLSGLQAIEK